MIMRSRIVELEAVSVTILSFLSVQQLCGVLDGKMTAARPFIRNMVDWVLRTWSTRGWTGLVQDVKGISLYSRSCSLSCASRRSYKRLLVKFGLSLSSREKAAQVSTLGRALPPALPDQRRKALIEHRASLECPSGAPATDPSILSEIRSFALLFSKKYRPSQPLARPWLAPRSCFEAKRAEGGQLGALAKWEAEFDSQEVLPAEVRRKPYSILNASQRETLFGPPPGEEARIVADSLYRDAEKLASLISFPREKVHKCRRVVIAEPGCKSRVVSSHEIDETSLGQYLRLMAQGALKRFPATAAVLRGNKLGAVSEVMRGRSHRKVVFSADLTNATDLLHQDAAIEMCTTVFRGWGVPTPLLERIPSLLGPHEFHDGCQPWRNNLGILMGGPLSWFTLCLMNSYCAGGVSLRKMVPFFRVCGDDLIAFFTKDQISRYKARCRSVGFHVNDTKSFVSHDSGLFAEMAFKLHFREESEVEPFPQLGAARQMIAFRVVRSVEQFPVIPAKLFRSSPNETLSWHSIGPSLDGSLEYLPPSTVRVLLRRCRRLIGIMRPKLASDIYRSGIDAGAPRCVGGAGLPWITNYKKVTRVVASILASKDLPFMAIRDGNGEVLLAGDLGGSYCTEASAEGSDLIRSCALGDIPANRVIYSPTSKPDVPVIGRWAQIVRDAEALHGRQLREWGCVPPLTGDPLSLSITRVAREVKRRTALILSVYPGAPPTSHLHESLRKRFNLDHLWALPYNDHLTTLHDAGSRRERRVPCGADVEQNRRFYRLLLPEIFQRHATGLT